jgi:hypothetical protein
MLSAVKILHTYTSSRATFAKDLKVLFLPSSPLTKVLSDRVLKRMA